jgi:hypothetical protein
MKPTPTPPGSPPVPGEKGGDLRATFGALCAEWKEQSAVLSSATQMARLPSYRQIIALGPAVVPLLLEELRREPDHWFIALQHLTGADPVQEENRGDLLAMARDWLTWGSRHGYLEENDPPCPPNSSNGSSPS